MIDISKKYKTRDGRDVRIYATDGAGICSVHGAIKNNEGWLNCAWLPNGSCYSGLTIDSDLIEVKPRHKQTVWLNVYEDGIAAYQHDDKEFADFRAGLTRIACIKVELDFEEGEGL